MMFQLTAVQLIKFTKQRKARLFKLASPGDARVVDALAIRSTALGRLWRPLSARWPQSFLEMLCAF